MGNVTNVHMITTYSETARPPLLQKSDIDMLYGLLPLTEV